MTHAYGATLGGIRSLGDIMARCHVDEITGCWHWRYGRDGNGNPSLWLPDLRKRTSLGVAIGLFVTGSKPTQLWHCTCETRGCANPAHRAPGNRQSAMRAAGIKRTALQKARITSARRKGSALSEAAVAEIRGSGDILRVLSERHGISVSHASRIRRGAARRPMAAAGASVFSLGAA